MAEDIARRVASRIRELREAQGFSLRELARRSKMPPEVVSRSERGITEITITSLAKLCEGLGVDLSEFFSFHRRPLETHAGSAEVRELFALLSERPPVERRRLAKAMCSLIGGPRSGARRS